MKTTTVILMSSKHPKHPLRRNVFTDCPHCLLETFHTIAEFNSGTVRCNRCHGLFEYVQVKDE